MRQTRITRLSNSDIHTLINGGTITIHSDKDLEFTLAYDRQRQHGDNGSKKRRMRKYSKETKRRALAFLATGKTLAETEKQFNVPFKTIWVWKNRVEKAKK